MLSGWDHPQLQLYIPNRGKLGICEQKQIVELNPSKKWGWQPPSKLTPGRMCLGIYCDGRRIFFPFLSQLLRKTELREAQGLMFGGKLPVLSPRRGHSDKLRKKPPNFL